MNRKLLHNKNFILLTLGRFISTLGTYLQNFGLSLYILKETHDATLFASTLAISYIPQVILGPFAGVLADRFNRKNLMVILDLISGIILGFFSLQLFLNNHLSVFQIYFIQLSLATINTFFTPVSMSMLPNVVEKEERKDANSLNSFMMSAVNLLSPLLGGFIYVFGLFPLMALNSLSFILSAISEMFIKLEKNKKIKEKLKIKSFLNDLKEGVFLLIKDKKIIAVIFIAFVSNLTISPFFSIGVPYLLKTTLNIDDKIYGLTISFMVSGLFIGPILANILMKKYSSDYLIKKCYIFSSIYFAIGGILFMPSIVFAYKFIIIGIIGWLVMATLQIFSICLVTDFQNIVPNEYYGRVGALFNTVATGSIPIGQIVIGFMFQKMLVMYIFFNIGIFLIISAYIYSFLLKDNGSNIFSRSIN